MLRSRLFLLTLSLSPLTACGDKESDDDTGGSPTITDEDGDGFAAEDDCDDADAAVNPDAAEVCDGIDNDCDDLIDDADDDVDLSTGSTFYGDADGDGYGAPGQAVEACEAPAGTATTDDDCDDDDADVNPGATEVCDDADVDEDCSGAADDADAGVDASTQTTVYVDGDADGYGDSADAGAAYCDPPSGTVTDNTDCDDADAAVNPAATEVCDDADVDEDCSGAADDADSGVDPTTQATMYVDGDSDGYGDSSDGGTLYCDPPSGTVAENTDCDDTDGDVNPAATEVCDDADVDEDCSGAADDADSGVDTSTQTTVYVDSDADGYGDETDSGTAYCDPPSGTVTDNTDCDDGDGDVNPAATEVCDDADVDEDCNGVADDADSGVDVGTRATWYPDLDGDGYGDLEATGTVACDVASSATDNTDCDDSDATVNPGEAEVCDTVDNDCDATTSQDGMVAFTDATGAVSDVTATFSGGTSGSPATVTVSADGDYAFCDGTYYANITVEADASFTGVAGAVTLDGGDTDSVFLIEDDGLTVEIASLEIQGGVADSLALLGYTAGGGIACDAVSELSLTDVGFSDNGAELGGAIASTDCDITLADGVIEDSYALLAGGGIFLSGTGEMTVTDSEIVGNEATYGGGFYIYDSGVLDLEESLVSLNTAESGGGGFVFDVTGTPEVTCTGSTSTTAGFTENESTNVPGALAIEDGGGDYILTFDECDFGRLVNGDDNDEAGVHHAGPEWFLGTGDDVTFSCDATGCGTTDTWSLGDSGGTDFDYSGDDRMRGNIFLGTAEGTIDTVGLYVNPDATCVFDYYVLSNSTLTASGWVTEFASTGNAVSSTGWAQHEATDAGVVVHPGTYYAVVTGWTCSGSSDNVEYVIESGSPTDLPVGTHEANVQMSYSTALGASGVTLSVVTDTPQYVATLQATAF